MRDLSGLAATWVNRGHIQQHLGRYGAARTEYERAEKLARKIGREDAARAVATAMSKNPIPLVVPCHRVIYASGLPGGFSAEGGEALKVRMLELERSSRG